ncbi:MAG: hypothetical protein QXU18_10880 [Thermoplasmatales archaeon]
MPCVRYFSFGLEVSVKENVGIVSLYIKGKKGSLTVVTLKAF